MSKDRTASFNLNAFTNIFSTPSVVTSPSGVPWYETLNCKDSVDIIFEYEEKAQESFVGMGYFLKRIKEKELYKELGYDNMWTFAKEQVNMDESAVSRFINLCEKYSKDNNSPILDDKYKGYSKSQLVEMLSIKDEQIMEKLTPELTVKQIREIKKESTDEPTDYYIRKFFNHCLLNISEDEYADLKNYMIDKYGKSHAGGSGIVSYKCSPRGISINVSKEITWAKFVSRVYLLEDLVPECIKNPVKDNQDDVLPGQMHIENDFPQYCPDTSDQREKASLIADDVKICDVANDKMPEAKADVKFPEKEEVIIDGEFREIQQVTAPDVSEKKEIKTYREKIKTILDNKLEYNGDNQKAIEDVKTWLCCEWQCYQISMEDYGQLKDMVEPIAERKIKDM